MSSVAGGRWPGSELCGQGLLRPERTGRLLALCPAGIVSGGPELIHQFVYQARLLGVDADVVYYPLERASEVPRPYKRYVKCAGSFRDSSADVVVMPEAATGMARRFLNARKVIWWLSFDNYYRSFRGRVDGPAALNTILRLAHGFRSIGAQLAWSELRAFGHLTQSHYAGARLRELGIEAVELSDYLRDDYLKQSQRASVREPLVAYYPLKGQKVSRQIIESLPDIKFRGIVGMDAEAVLGLLRSCSVYMDFGHHPGKDRLPREAAICGACVITGRQGSAGNEFDVPIPPQYKIDESAADFLSQVGSLLRSMCSDPSAHSTAFESYRKAIMAEPARFLSRLRTLVGEDEAREAGD